MSLENSLYHRILRVLVVTFAFVLLFESGVVFQSTSELSRNTHQYVANVVGVGASVRPTELNTLTAELTEQRLLLDQREAALRAREIEIELSSGGSSETSTYIVAAILFVLLVLIVTNYVLDYLRIERPRRNTAAVPVQ